MSCGTAQAAVRLAGLGPYVDLGDDVTLCFISNRAYRTCSDCGTVFVVSTWGGAGAGRCPFCRGAMTRPAREEQ